MLAYIVRRLFQLVIVLIGVTIITFIILFAVPGNPAQLLAGKDATPERIAIIGHDLGLDKPLYVQYYKFVVRLLHGDLGESYALQQPVTTLIKQNIGNTAQLAVAAVLIEMLGIPLGVYSAMRQYTFWDTALTTTALIIWGIPVFVLGEFLLQFFWIQLPQWVNSLFGTAWGGLPTTPGHNVWLIVPASWASVGALILPAFTLGILEVAYISYMQRAAMLEVIRSDYIRTARAKGLSERKVVLKHGLKNAIIPVMTIAGIDLGALMGGAILTETVFNRPGVGLLIYQAIGARDLPVVCGGVLFATLVYVIANLIVDIAYAYVDPRIRLGE
jgi:peptide/nickel transport system permease protein